MGEKRNHMEQEKRESRPENRTNEMGEQKIKQNIKNKSKGKKEEVWGEGKEAQFPRMSTNNTSIPNQFSS